MPFDRSQPLYLQVIENLSARIADGTWAQGQAIPSEPRLAHHLRVSQGTVRKALARMADDGLVERRQGVGTFVAAPDAARIASFFVDASGEAMLAELRSQVLLEEPVPAHAAARLGVDDGAPGWCIEQLSCLGNRPAFVERIHIPRHLIPDLSEAHLPANLPELWSNLTGRVCHRVTQVMRPLAAPGDLAWAIQVPTGTPITHIEQTGFDLSGTAIDMRDTYVAPGPWGLRADHDVGKKW